MRTAVEADREGNPDVVVHRVLPQRHAIDAERSLATRGRQAVSLLDIDGVQLFECRQRTLAHQPDRGRQRLAVPARRPVQQLTLDRKR